jgi:hypothetical protein
VQVEQIDAVSGGLESRGGAAGGVRGEGIGPVVCDHHKCGPGSVAAVRHVFSWLVSVVSTSPVHP